MKSCTWLKPFALAALAALLLSSSLTAKADKDKKEKPVRIFTLDVKLPHTPVKDQYWTGTCWDFSTTSFIESELLRLGRGEFDLSEMYAVRRTYPRKALAYVRLHGGATFGEGGQSHDVLDSARVWGMVPENVYPGMNIAENRHNHGELFAVLKAMLDAVLKVEGKRVSPRWPEALEAVLDAYLGRATERFEYAGKSHTPQSFMAEVLGFDPDNYVEMTSYSHHPFYQRCRLEIPDNWSFNDGYINLPIDELEEAVDHALKSGFTVVWDGDVSEKEFSTRETGYAIVPLKSWEEKTQAERDATPASPEAEKEITQELRQQTFDNFSTTDDHLMHIVGLARDQQGNKFYWIKNSGGTDRKNGGYLYMSRAYFRLKTVAVTMAKTALPAEIARKTGSK
jgi:bleomycin hydrolase